FMQVDETGRGYVNVLAADKLMRSPKLYATFLLWQLAEMFETLVLDIPELLEVHRMTGDRDYLLKAVVTDMSGYDLLFKQLSKADLIDISSSFVMETMKHTTRLPLTYVADN
ncbi:MAG: DUF853 family protein, partial [Pseudomonadales bacterium]|nr:DUF853 family protein [Pseudomonadales bacterium]